MARPAKVPRVAEMPAYPGVPRWVKVLGIVAIVAFLFVLFNVLAGGGGGTGGSHGPGDHATREAGTHPVWGRLMLLGVLCVAVVTFIWGWLVDRDTIPPRPGKSSSSGGVPGRAPMNMTARARKFVLAAHVTSSVGSLGAVAVFLALAIVGLTSQDAQVVRAAYIVNGFIAWYVILPLILAALLIGVVQSLSTPWGLFRHYWVLAKLLLTVLTVIVLLIQMGGISYVAAVAADPAFSSADMLGLRGSFRTHATGGLVILLLLVALSIYKPRGVTRYGWRKQRERSPVRAEHATSLLDPRP